MAPSVSWLPASWRGNFPHLAPLDREIWLRFLDAQANQWQAFAYDVAVGGQEAPSTVTDPAIRKAWRFNTSKRIDVLGQRPDELAIFEVRPNAQASALGHVLTYCQLFKEQYPDPRPCRLYVVTDYIADDVRRVMDTQGVRVLQLPPPATQL